MKKQTMTIDEKLNSVRAGVLGSNDGILTVVGVLFSVSAASGSSFALLIASLANLISGAFSMVSGEYASVSSQSDSEKVVFQEKKILLKKDFKNQKAAVKDFYIEKIKRSFSVDLSIATFSGSKKWSDNVKDAFLTQAQRWTDVIEKKVKMTVAEAIPDKNADEVLNQHKRSSIDALVAALENMLTHR